MCIRDSPTRDRRRPARYLSTVSVSDAAAREKGGRRRLGESVKVNKRSLLCEELTDNCGLTCTETLSVASRDEMLDRWRGSLGTGRRSKLGGDPPTGPGCRRRSSRGGTCYGGERSTRVSGRGAGPVSYTHLTLPTKRIV